MSRRVVLASALALAGLAATDARTAELTVKDVAAIRKVFDGSRAYVLAGNWAGWAGLHAEDAVLQPPNAPSVKGRAAILAWGKAFPAIEDVTISVSQVAGDGNIAFATTSYTLKLKGAPADTGKELCTFRRSSAGRWEVVVCSFNSDLAVSGQAQPAAAKK